MTQYYIQQLIKNKRTFKECNPPKDRRAELFCERCKCSIGEYDLTYLNLKINVYCSEHQSMYIRPTPFTINLINDKPVEVIKDTGGYVNVKYKDGGYYQELAVSKQCYFNSKGRYICIGGHRYYLNLNKDIWK